MKISYKMGNVPIGSVLSIIFFIWTVNDGFWSKLDWFTGGLFGLALILLFFGNLDYKRTETT